jgi:uncharacterized protein (TIRG00374 family)
MKLVRLIPIALWACALGLCAWLLRDFPLSVAVESLSKISALQFTFWIAVNVGILWLATFRWQLLGKSVACTLSLWSLFLVRMGGQTISFLTPGPQFGGEPVQIYWLMTRFGVSLKRAVLALGLDRLYELWINFFVLLTGLLIVLNSFQWAADTFYIQTPITVFLLMTLLILPLLLYRFRDRIQEKIALTLNSYLAKTNSEKFNTVQKSDEFANNLSLSRDHIIALGVSLLVWVGIFIELQLIVYMLDIKLGALEIMTLLCFIRLAMLLPLPGGIGSIEAAIILFFQLLSLDIELAFSVIALCRLRDVVLLSAGLACLYSVQRKEKIQVN